MMRAKFAGVLAATLALVTGMARVYAGTDGSELEELRRERPEVEWGADDRSNLVLRA